MTALVTAADAVKAHLRDAILVSRAEARALAASRVLAEFRHAAPDTLHAPKPADALTDTPRAIAAAGSYASAWLSASLAAVSRSDNASAAVAQATQRLSYRLDTIAATEVSQAYNDEHRAEWDQVATDHRGAIWLGLLLRRWDATLDRKVCAVCRAHDGKVAVIGFGFDGGDEPGFVHPRCRCFAAVYTAETVATRILSEAA